MLPRHWSREILEGLLGATVVGFHTDEYVTYFLQSVSALGYPSRDGKLTVQGRAVRAATFPMGIDAQRFKDAAASVKGLEEKAVLRKSVGDAKVVLSIDRLDYTKGIANRLLGYQSFLEANPEWHGRVALLMILVPSRIGVDDYRDMKRQIDELVGRINGAFGSVHWTPILYQYRYLPFEELVPLYAVGDVCLVTPLKDGMNLIAKEYLASRTGRTGVLVLSETAGASQELAAAILVNPHHVGEIAVALKQALEMSEEEQAERNRRMHAVLERSSVRQWAGGFIATLRALHAGEKSADTTVPDSGAPYRLAGLQRVYYWLKSRRSAAKS
jgi:trehalose 6-phosphate synthase/phosphatase